MKKETAAQRVERIKDEKNGLDVLADIYKYASSVDEVDPEDIDRFKWYGLYTQNKNAQGKDDNSLYFMLRVKLEKGVMNLEQLRVISDISFKYAKQTATLTTRQDIQFHNILVKDLPAIFESLNSVGLSTIFAAGDVPRNVISCPVSSIEHDEIIDVEDIVSKVNDYFRGNKELSNLPRKYKVGISGCSKHCMGHEIQDISFTAVNLDNNILFDVSVGGGLASNKRIASHIGYVKKEDILTVVETVSIIYRDFGLRESRKKARLGHLIDSWGIEKFIEKVESEIGFNLKQRVDPKYTPYSKREHFGVHKSKIDGYSYIGCAINGGKLGAKGLSDLVQSLEKYGATTVRATITQNFVITDVPTQNVQSLVDELKLQNIEANPSSFKARTISCTGIEFCKFAIVETKKQAIELANYLEKRFPDFEETISISVNGCPNSCAHPHVVDIGLLGTKLKDENGNTVTGFDLIVGGNLEGVKSSFGEKTKLKMKPEQVNGTVEKIILAYQKSNYTNLHGFMKEISTNQEFFLTLL